MTTVCINALLMQLAWYHSFVPDIQWSKVTNWISSWQQLEKRQINVHVKLKLAVRLNYTRLFLFDIQTTALNIKVIQESRYVKGEGKLKNSKFNIPHANRVLLNKDSTHSCWTLTVTALWCVCVCVCLHWCQFELPSCCHCCRYKVFIFVWTFFIYTSYHLSRKPFSVVKVL